ncbi:MAG: twitching motility protein PilT [Proteobacteria bacterium HN_bin10]|nr:MAG: twitching motility protein PilT [Proteobacteria bacterium HN_bin10]
MYLLDTNVISELRRQRPHGGVVAWLQSVDDRDLRLAAITLAEIQAGIEITREQNEARAAELETWLDQVAATYNVLDMDGRTFRLWARLMHGRGEHLLEDAMIAATARVHGLVVVTRNTRDFAPFGVKTLNPFKTG